MIEGRRDLELGPCSTRMDLNNCTYSAAKAVVRDNASVGPTARFRDYPVNLSVRRLTSFLSCRKCSFTEANKIYISSTEIRAMAIPFTLAGFNPIGRVCDRRILG